jgi:hypothetical protein
MNENCSESNRGFNDFYASTVHTRTELCPRLLVDWPRSDVVRSSEYFDIVTAYGTIRAARALSENRFSLLRRAEELCKRLPLVVNHQQFPIA